MTKIFVSLDRVTRAQGVVTASAAIAGVTNKSQRLWYRIASEREPDALTLAHTFAVSTINMAMALGRDLAIDGPLTRGLLLNLHEYQAAWVRWMPDRFHPIDIQARELVADVAFRPERRFVVPFSGGLDSMYTAWCLHQRGMLGALVPIQGLDIAITQDERWSPTLARLRDCAGSLGVPLCAVQTNWNYVARDLPGYLGYFLPVVTVPWQSRRPGPTITSNCRKRRPRSPIPCWDGRAVPSSTTEHQRIASTKSPRSQRGRRRSPTCGAALRRWPTAARAGAAANASRRRWHFSRSGILCLRLLAVHHRRSRTSSASP
jgi:hypothetical protein